MTPQEGYGFGGRPGDVVEGRFEVLALAGKGGMGLVFKARDLQTGQDVALKLFHERDRATRERFLREAEVLKAADDPTIVGYVAHGVTSGHQLYLCMEWLEGEPLDDVLAERGLTAAEAVRMAHRVARALAAGHARGVVHRDVKPANLFLEGGDPERVRLLDFGVARFTGARSQTLTQPGAVVGTAGYIAPEQARGAEVGPQADVFALGCVLFYALTGVEAFGSDGDNLLVALLKIVLEDAPRVRELRPELPQGLDEVVARMLAREPSERYRDGGAVAAALGAWLDTAGGAPLEHKGVPALGERERQVLSVVLVRPTSAGLRVPVADFKPLAGRFGGTLDALVDGTLYALLTGSASPEEDAVAAGRCALALRAALPGASIALATGTGQVDGGQPLGDVIERASALLGRRGGNRGRGAIVLDEATARLVETRLEVDEEGGRFVLARELDRHDRARRLLGRATPCVGRKKELGLLGKAYAEVQAFGQARAVVMTGPAGAGKSRLRHEFLGKLRGERILIARGESHGGKGAFGMLVPPILRALGIRRGDPPSLARRLMEAKVKTRLPEAQAERVATFLGELLGLPGDESSPLLRHARQDPQLMADQVRIAFIDWLEAECRAGEGPLVLVLEDLHWGDRPTVLLVEAAFEALAELPLMVLVSARPELAQRHPELLARGPVTRFELAPLSPSAARELAIRVLGPTVSDTMVDHIVTTADGNAFYLEELIRVASESGDERPELPDTVVGMAQARLRGLSQQARKLLRAGSVFGRVFGVEGVAALLGGERPDKALVDALVADELLAERAGARIKGDRELVFRHSLVRDAAYAMLTEQDRTLGHRLAGEFLEASGLHNPVEIAGHYAQGGAPEQAARWWAEAAADALAGSDLTEAVERAELALASGPALELEAATRTLLSEALILRGDLRGGQHHAMIAAEQLEPTGAGYFRAVEFLLHAAGLLYEPSVVVPWAHRLLAAAPDSVEAREAWIQALCRAGWHLATLGETTLCGQCYGAADAQLARLPHRPPLVTAKMNRVRAKQANDADRLEAAVELYQTSARHFEQGGDLRNACTQRVNAGYLLNMLGAYERGLAALEAAKAHAERIGLDETVAFVNHNLGYSQMRLGRFEEAVQTEEAAAAWYSQSGVLGLRGGTLIYLADALVSCGRHDEAMQRAAEALQLFDEIPTLRPSALAMLAHVALASGDVGRALAVATESARQIDALERVEYGVALTRACHVEALEASGDRLGATLAAQVAVDELAARARRIENPAVRALYVYNVPENRRAIEAAARLGVRLPPPLG